MKWEKFIFDVLPSTNTWAVDYPAGAVIVAKAQTSGRGRYGRAWLGKVGNLYMSAVLPVDNNAPFMPFVVGVALCQALQDFSVQLKWPNDVLINGEKVGGVLIEIENDKMIIGMGVNVAYAPENLPYKAASLQGNITTNQLCDSILAHLSDTLNTLNTAGFAPIRDVWLKNAYRLGEKIKVNLPNETITGIFKTITPLGALDLETHNQHRYITAGDVFFI